MRIDYNKLVPDAGKAILTLEGYVNMSGLEIRSLSCFPVNFILS